jgi:hypothetical protein
MHRMDAPMMANLQACSGGRSGGSEPRILSISTCKNATSRSACVSRNVQDGWNVSAHTEIVCINRHHAAVNQPFWSASQGLMVCKHPRLQSGCCAAAAGQATEHLTHQAGSRWCSGCSRKPSSTTTIT